MTQTSQQPQGGQQANTQLTSQNATALKRMQEETTQQIMDRVNGWQETGELVLPKGYHVGNAIKMAWLYLQTVENMSKQKAIDVCTKDSICNALLQMVIHGEYPQKHCYFIMYGDRLEWNERYLGKLMRAKRDTEIEKVNAQVIYEGDEFVYTIDDDGQKQLVKHVPNLRSGHQQGRLTPHRGDDKSDDSERMGAGSDEGQERSAHQVHRPDVHEDGHSESLQDCPRQHG